MHCLLFDLYLSLRCHFIYIEEDNVVSCWVQAPEKIMMCEVCRAADMEKTAALTSGSQQDCRVNLK